MRQYFVLCVVSPASFTIRSSVVWISPGIYFYQLHTPEFSTVRKLAIAKVVKIIGL